MNLRIYESANATMLGWNSELPLNGLLTEFCWVQSIMNVSKCIMKLFSKYSLWFSPIHSKQVYRNVYIRAEKRTFLLTSHSDIFQVYVLEDNERLIGDLEIGMGQAEKGHKEKDVHSQGNSVEGRGESRPGNQEIRVLISAFPLIYLGP